MEAPQRKEFETYDEYHLAFITWRAIRRDGKLTRDEEAARFKVIDRKWDEIGPQRSFR